MGFVLFGIFAVMEVGLLAWKLNWQEKTAIRLQEKAGEQ